MLGEFDLAASTGSDAAGRADDEHDGAVGRAARGQPRLVVGSAGSLRLRGAIMQIVIERRRPRDVGRGGGRLPALPPRRATCTARAAPTRPSSTGSRRCGYERRPLAPAQPLLRRRGRGRDARGRQARRRRRSAPRRRRHRRRVTRLFTSAGPSRATPRRSSRSPAPSAAEPEGWLITRELLAQRRRRAPLPEGAPPPRRRRGVRRRDGRRRARRPALGRPRPASRQPARRRPRPHGRRRPPPPGDRHARCSSRPSRWAHETDVSKLELHVFPHNDACDRAVREVRLRPRGLPARPLPPRGRARGRRPDGLPRAVTSVRFRRRP